MRGRRAAWPASEPDLAHTGGGEGVHELHPIDTLSLPRIAAYPMPRETELPASQAGWRPEPGRAALLVPDMQRYFLGAFPPGASPVAELITNAARLRSTFASLGLPVVFSAEPGCTTGWR